METQTPDNLFMCISMLARERATSDEEHERIMDLADALATRRAELLQQPYSPVDLVYGLSVLCHWPFKPEPLFDYQAFVDTTLIPTLLELEPTPTVIAGQFPDEALTLDLGELFRRLEDGSLQGLIESGFGGS